MSRHSAQSQAELALRQKYELLKQKKKEQAAQEARKSSEAPGRTVPEAPKRDAAREEAIKRLKARRDAEQGVTAATTGPAKPSPAARDGAPLKIKFVIPKQPKADASRQPAVGPSTAATAAAKPASTPASAPAAKPPQPAASAPAVGSQMRPALKRPAIRRPAPSQTPANADHVWEQPQSGGQQEVEDDGTAGEAGAKRWRGDHGNAAAADPYAQQQPQSLPDTPQLFVADLPEHYDSQSLADFFLEFGNAVVDARVVPGCCYGFVTFASYEEAQDLLDFQTQQPVEVEDRHIHLSWARPGDGGMWPHAGGGMAGGGGGVDPHTEHPRIREARAHAAEVAAQIDQHMGAAAHQDAPPPSRDLVTYDDL